MKRTAEPLPWWKKTRSHFTLVGMQCGVCERKFFPPRRTCPNCGSRNTLKPIDLPVFGKLVTWTVTRVLPEEHEEKEAVLGLADFGGALILAKIRRIEAKRLAKDLLLSIEVEPSGTEPEPQCSFYFVPTENHARNEE